MSDLESGAMPPVDAPALSAFTQRAPNDQLVLDYEGRKRSRQPVTLASGRAAALLLPSGTVLRHGDRLQAADEPSLVVAVCAAPEPLDEALADNPLLFARAAYHLGNRHVPVEIAGGQAGWRLRFQPDHVLASMLRGLGCRVTAVTLPFHPEAGAYAGAHDTHHGHGDHAHLHHHPHDHGNDAGTPGEDAPRGPRIHEFPA